MAQPWLEDLSEEWVAQPTPPTVACDIGDSVTTQITQSVPPKPRSRLPRMRQSSGSFSEIQVRQVVKDLRPPKSRNALAERSLSDNNIPLSTSADPSHVAPSRGASQCFSGISQDSIAYNGTVAQHTVAKSPVKDKAAHETPEWRRRLLQGDIKYGDQKDLFSPMGLENIFQKPNGPSSEDLKQPKRRTGLFNDLSGMPSSPPPWPTSEHNAEQTQHENQAESVNDDSSRVQAAESFSMTNIPGMVNRGEARTVSGQIEFENENFSPVYLTTNLKIGTTPKPTPNFRGSELANRLRQIGSPPPSPPQPISEENSVIQPREDSSFARLQDDSFPEGLPAGTPEFAEVGRFVELRRGGYSRDGSFRRRPLSPSPQAKVAQHTRLAGNNSTMNGTKSATQTEEEYEIIVSTGSPKTPRRQGEKHLSPERTHNSASPLKLFDAHDTFTSNRLQRRLSQLDYKSEKTTSSSKHLSRAELKHVAQKTSRLTSVEEVSIQQTATKEANGYHPDETEARRVETFGEGQLNEYQFSGDFSVMSSHPSEGLASAPDESPSIDVAPPGSRQPFKFHFDESPVSREPSRAKRQGLTRVSNPFRRANRSISQSLLGGVSATETQLGTEIHHEYPEGKRGATSPGKNPTPKRRRTIYSVDEEGDEGEDVLSDTGVKTVHDSHVAMQSVIGRKRKDARHDSSSNVADPDVLARRHILRPRNPTPSQRRRDEIQAEIMEATEAFILSSPKLNTIREHLEPALGLDAPSEEARAAVVANEVAEFSMQRRQAIRDESRKKSVTTQDFLDEAVKIMDYIRAKGRPASGLDSLEETDSESPIKQHGNEYPSSSLTFERPPSREGCLSAWKEPNKRQLDPNVMSHLRKYQEKESDTFLNSSINSLRFSRMRGPQSPDEQSILAEQDDIRITENINRCDKLQSADDDHTNSQPRTAGTHQSTGSSLGLTVATSASRRSDHVPTLAPEAVAHLIPKEIAGMSFDHEKNIWVRQKSPSREDHAKEEEVSGLNESEEDPFGNIPDLTVDEVKEQEGLQKGSITRQQPTAETFMEETEESVTEKDTRPVTREGHGIPPTETSSVPSKFSNFAWSYPKTETRATSWSEPEPRNWGTQKTQQILTTQAIPESDEDEVEHEIQYYESRGTARSTMRKTRVRDITISIAERDFGDVTDVQEPISSPQRRGTHRWEPSNIGHNTQLRGAKTLPNARPARRPVFEGDGELSLLEDPSSKNYRMQLSMSVSAPVLRQGHQETLIPALSSPAKGDITFMLSELPEFTLNQIDECELPDRVVVKHNGARFSKELEDRYAQGTAELVKALQDAEPDEPYWEDLREVDLHDKGLTNLHRLDEFCYRLEELDVSHNSISQVKGIPYTMRRLTAHHNCLTGLTSWAMLMNLQHLDISSNDIDSLDGLSELVHLRSLKANDNKISSLDGILHLDGLMELSAGGNLIEIADFSTADLKSLVDLDLRGNPLVEVRNLHRLSQLQHLNLDDNRIEEFPIFDIPSGKCNMLRSLRVCRNGMTALELGNFFPKLESLYVDGNSLVNVPGLEHLRYLRTFSARDQMLDTDEDAEACVGGMMMNPDVRNLYISLNPTHGLELTQHLLNLQRLELSSMGLKELPDNFGQLTPNIRSINLNFNSIRDLRPLLNIKRLSELLLAGNKLERLRANAMVLGKLTTLSKLDWRDNPITLRFYSPASENRVMSLRQKPSDEQTTDRFVLPDGDAEADKQYLSRLDYETRIRRRVTEMMLANFCKNLRELDGLPFNKARVLVKDDVWERLLLLGVIQRKQMDETDEIME